MSDEDSVVPGSGGVPPDAAALAAAVRTCPSVADLSGGSMAEFATYLPGERVVGIRVAEDSVDVHLVVRGSVSSLPAAGDEVRTRLLPLVGGRSVNVFIEDVAMEEHSVHASDVTPS
ncbi:MAG: hypothetical protein NVS3B21_07650 [Acidimicrobiales bacterium]